MADSVSVSELLIVAGADRDEVAKFIAYHKKNPRIFAKFREYSETLIGAGRKDYSAWCVINKIRWDNDIQVETEDFKISNNFIGYYARALMWTEKKFDGFFTTRPLKGKLKAVQETY